MRIREIVGLMSIVAVVSSCGGGAKESPAASPATPPAEAAAPAPAEATPAPSEPATPVAATEPARYPEDLRTAFMEECVKSAADAGDAREPACRCVLDQMERHFTVDQVADGLTAEQQEQLTQWATDCYVQARQANP